jgi:nitrogen PTS system EIIA component
VPSLSRFLGPGRVLDLAGGDRESVLRALVEPVAEATGLGADGLLAAVLEREATLSTGFGGGVAMPHIRHPGATGFHTVLGRVRAGVEFGAIDGLPVHLLLLVVGPESQTDGYRKLMRRAAAFLKAEHHRLIHSEDLFACTADALADH